MDMERLLVDREGLGTEEDTARREEVDSFGSAEEGDNHSSWIVGAQKIPLLILAGPSLPLKSCLYSNCPFHSVWECGWVPRARCTGPTLWDPQGPTQLLQRRLTHSLMSQEVAAT